VGEAAGAIPYIDHIRNAYDPTQSAAIEACASLAISPAQLRHFSSTSAVRSKQQQQQQQKVSLLPVVLIQGPPGTGKTHTVTVCSVWLATCMNPMQDTVGTAPPSSDFYTTLLPQIAKQCWHDTLMQPSHLMLKEVAAKMTCSLAHLFLGAQRKGSVETSTNACMQHSLQLLPYHLAMLIPKSCTSSG
jgi:hypothetical protein